MKAVIQKVSSAETIVDGELVSSIKKGIVIFLGIAIDDDESDIDWLINKITKLRIFNTFDNNINDVKGEVLLISQFTLQANVLKGNRPSFIKAAKPDKAEDLYNKFIDNLKSKGIKVETGQFQTMMDVSLINWGPVTLEIEK